MEVSKPLFVIGIKDTVGAPAHRCPGGCGQPLLQNLIQKHIAIEILLNILIGKSSKLYKKLYEEELLMSEVFSEYEFTNSYAHILITGQSKDPKKVLEELKKEISNLKENGIPEEDFIRIKHMLYGNYVKEFNSVSDISRAFLSDYFKGVNSFDYIENCDKITKEYTQQILNEVFAEDKTVISIVKGKN